MVVLSVSYHCPVVVAGCSVGAGNSAASSCAMMTTTAKNPASGGSSNRRQKSPARLHPLLANQQTDARSNVTQSSHSVSSVDVKME